MILTADGRTLGDKGEHFLAFLHPPSMFEASSSMEKGLPSLKFTITHVMDCLADPTKNRVVAECSLHISPVFPYLNAIVSQAQYNAGLHTLTLRKDGRLLTFYPLVATLAKVEGQEDAEAILSWFRDLCGEVWSRRHEITPRYERRTVVGPLDVYQLLPRLNCGRCGEEACLAFAAGLIMGERRISECPPILAAEHAAGFSRLKELLGA